MPKFYEKGDLISPEEDKEHQAQKLRDKMQREAAFEALDEQRKRAYILKEYERAMHSEVLEEIEEFHADFYDILHWDQKVELDKRIKAFKRVDEKKLQQHEERERQEQEKLLQQKKEKERIERERQEQLQRQKEAEEKRQRETEQRGKETEEKRKEEREKNEHLFYLQGFRHISDLNNNPVSGAHITITTLYYPRWFGYKYKILKTVSLTSETHGVFDKDSLPQKNVNDTLVIQNIQIGSETFDLTSLDGISQTQQKFPRNRLGSIYYIDKEHNEIKKTFLYKLQTADDYWIKKHLGSILGVHIGSNYP